MKIVHTVHRKSPKTNIKIIKITGKQYKVYSTLKIQTDRLNSDLPVQEVNRRLRSSISEQNR